MHRYRPVTAAPAIPHEHVCCMGTYHDCAFCTGTYRNCACCTGTERVIAVISIIPIYPKTFKLIIYALYFHCCHHQAIEGQDFSLKVYF